MKLTFRTVTNKVFHLELEPSTKIGDVKSRIQADQGDTYPAGSTVLIYQGKVLKDDTTLEDAKVAETNFLVVMVQKPKASAKPAAAAKPATPANPTSTATATPQATSSAGPASQAAPVSTTPALTTPATTTPATVATPGAPGPAPPPAEGTPAPAATGQPGGSFGDSASTLAMGSALEQQITQITEMGFPKDEVKKAMRAAFNNPDRAVEYLMNGIPAGVEQQPAPAARSPASATPPAAGVPTGGVASTQPASQGPNAQPLDMFAPQRPGGASGGGGGGGEGGPLDFLRNQPRFETLRALVQQSPALLNPLLQEIGRSDPNLMQLINNNQQEFMRMLSEPPPPGTDLGAALAGAGVGGGAGGGMPVEIQLTQEEAAAVQRLEGMGFSRDLCLEAFLACDRNEELAANYLLENGMEDA